MTVYGDHGKRQGPCPLGVDILLYGTNFQTVMGGSRNNVADGPTESDAAPTGGVRIRRPTADDGAAVWRLIGRCPPLDSNSLYCNLLQCTDFADTSLLAERDGQLLAWVSAYRPPRAPDTLFVWQVAVDSAARGAGLGRRLVVRALTPASGGPVRFLKTTVTPANKASLAMFRRVAEDLGAPFDSHPHFDRIRHFGDTHDTELLLTIGPIITAASAHRQPPDTMRAGVG